MKEEKIYNSVLNFLAPLSLKETCKRVTQEAMKLVGADYGNIFVPRSGKLKKVYASSSKLYEIGARREGNIMKAYKKNIFYVTRMKTLKKELTDLGIKDGLLAALTFNKVKNGVLSLLSVSEKKFGYNEKNLIKLYSPLASLAIRKAMLHEDLKKAVKDRDFFVSIASHELKTPLTSIILHSQILKKTIEEGKMPTMEQIENLISEEKRLTKLINEFLQINQIKRGELSFEMSECDLKFLIQTALDSGQKLLKGHVVDFKDRIEKERALIWGDFDKLLQVVINLLHNAAKYSPEGLEISINLKSSGSNFILKIKDQGQGIPKTDIPYIFDKFYKATNSKKIGMGIGLYLVKYIIQKHSGEIWANSKIGKGTTVTLKLPKYEKGRKFNSSTRSF